MTRAQSRKEAATKDETKAQGAEEPKGKKKICKHRTHSRSSKKSKGETPKIEKSVEKPNEIKGETSEPKQPNKAHKESSEPQPSNEGKESTKPSSGGSIIVKKVNESLQVALDAYNNLITPLTEIPKKFQEYPNPVVEKVRLAVFQQLIRDTQSTLEGPPPPIKQEPALKCPELETTPGESSIGDPRKNWQESILRERIRDKGVDTEVQKLIKLLKSLKVILFPELFNNCIFYCENVS